MWNVPFGHDRAFGKDTHAVVNFLLGDWDLSGIVTVQSGFPVAFSSRATNNNGQSAALDNPTIGHWFDKSVFSVAPTYTFGNVGPVLPDVRTDSVKNVDAVLVKNFRASIGDHAITTQFRSEFYNLFNHPQFAAPNGSVTSQSFGTVTAQANSPRDIQFGLKVSF